MINTLFKIFMLMFALSFMTSIKAQTTYTMKFDHSDYSFVTQSDGKLLIVPQKDICGSGEPGEPCLPIINLKLALPYGSTAKSVEFICSDSQKVKENVTLTLNPQLELSDMSDSEGFDDTNSDHFSVSKELNKLMGTSFWRGVPVAHIQASPFQYDELTGDLYFIDDMTINIELEEYNFEANFPDDIKELESELKYLVNNPKDVSSIVAQIPLATSENNKKVDYLIITSNDLIDSFSTLVDWKRKKGLVVNIVSTEDIETDYDCGWIYPNHHAFM